MDDGNELALYAEIDRLRKQVKAMEAKWFNERLANLRTQGRIIRLIELLERSNGQRKS